MHVRMLQDKAARSRDNQMVRLTYEKDVVYSLDESTATSFIRRGWAMAVTVVETTVNGEIVEHHVLTEDDIAAEGEPASTESVEPAADEIVSSEPATIPVAQPAVTPVMAPDEAPPRAAASEPPEPSASKTRKNRSFKAENQEIK